MEAFRGAGIVMPLTNELPECRDLFPTGFSVVYLGPDLSDSNTFRRCEAFHRLGVRVVSFTFKRSKVTIRRRSAWAHIGLGPMPYGLGMKRWRALWRAFRIVRSNRTVLAHTNVVWARNLDLALLALCVRSARTKLVYEVLDVSGELTRKGLAGFVLRWLERRVLAHAVMVVISSPAYASEYFRKSTPYQGSYYILENKALCPLSLVHTPTRSAKGSHSTSNALRLGVVGRFRCRRSIELLSDVMKICNRRIQLHFFGYPEKHVETAFQALLYSSDDVFDHGSFSYPEDLPYVYGQIDLNWCVLFEELNPINARWLLPNRIYDGALFTVPALALIDTATGRWVEEVGGGWLLREDSARELTSLLDSISANDIARVRDNLARQPRTRFRDNLADHANALFAAWTARATHQSSGGDRGTAHLLGSRKPH